MFSGFLQCWFSTINIIEALLQSPVGVVARTIKVGVVICCCHLGVCCEGMYFSSLRMAVLPRG